MSFPQLGKLDFFEHALAYIRGYRIKACLVAQSLNQIVQAYGEHSSILDNAHVRVAFACNDERTAKRISDMLGVTTETRAQMNYAGSRMAPWLGHTMVSRQEVPRPLLTPGEVMQLPASDSLILTGGAPPIRARKVRYFRGHDASRGLAMLTTALGPSIAAMLHAPDTIEVIANPDGRLWLGAGRQGPWSQLPIGLKRQRLNGLSGLSRPSPAPKSIATHPSYRPNCRPRGERFEGVLPPVSRAPCFAIRKPASRVFTLDDYQASGVITVEQASILRNAIHSHANIMVAGGTGSGKTTLANALLHEIAQLGERVVILEDTRELQCAAEDVVALRTKPGSVSLSDLVRSTLRLRPDRIVVGEVRGPEALDLLKAWNTGHPGGIATLHANSAQAALSRLEQLTMEVCETPPPRTLIAEAIDLIVFVERGGPAGRRIPEILAPKGLSLRAGPQRTPARGARR
jgi:type IV secretion system protein VirB11